MSELDGLDWGDPSLHKFLMQKADELLTPSKPRPGVATLRNSDAATPPHSRPIVTYRPPAYVDSPSNVSASNPFTFAASSPNKSVGTPVVQPEDDDAFLSVAKPTIDILKDYKRRGISLYDLHRNTLRASSPPPSQIRHTSPVRMTDLTSFAHGYRSSVYAPVRPFDHAGAAVDDQYGKFLNLLYRREEDAKLQQERVCFRMFPPFPES